MPLCPLFGCYRPGYNLGFLKVQTVLSGHLSNQRPGVDSAYLSPADPRAAAAASFNASKLDLNALMGKRRGAIPAFLSGVTNDSSSSSSNATGSGGGGGNSSSNGHQNGTSGENSALTNGGNEQQGAFFSFSKTSHSLSVNSYLRENRINMPFVS